MTDVLNTPSNRKNYQCQQIPTDLLNDLSSRFIINVPEEERVDLIRVCFQIELAHWFYLDFYCEEDPRLPKCLLKDFIRIIFGHIPFLQKYSPEVDSIIANWKEYKRAVPTFGGILLDEELKKVLLVQSYVSKSSWGFPKGKVNEDEPPHQCAIREVFEETGFDISHLIDESEYLEHYFNEQLIRLYIITGVFEETGFDISHLIDESEYLEHYFNEQLIRLYIITGVKPDIKFHPKTRKEIKSIEWFPVNALPTGRKDQMCKTNLGPVSFFMVIPFVKQLKKWIAAKLAAVQNSSSNNFAESEKYKTQQNLFAKLSQSEFSKYREIKTASENNTAQASDFNKVNRLGHSKPSYSPPPRMLRQKNLKQAMDSDKKKNMQSQTEERSYFKQCRKALDFSKENKYSKEKSYSKKDKFYPFSKTWANFSLDTESLISVFNTQMDFRMPTPPTKG